MAENLQQRMAGDTSAAETFFDTLRRSEHLQPEKDLLLAILEDALHTYRKYGRAHDPEGKKQFRETEEWIMEGGNDWVFSFNNVCEYLGLNPDYVRGGLREVKANMEAEEKPHHHHRMRSQAA